MHRIRLFLVALVAVVALSAPCWAEEELELRGRLEVLLADNFAEQSYHYKLFLHEDDTGRVLALNPTSFGDDLAQLRNDMKATVWAQNPPSSRRQRASITDEKTEEATLNDKNTLLDVVRFELTHDKPSTHKKRDEQVAGWELFGLRRLLVILVDFQDEQVQCSRADMAKRMWGEVAPSYQTNVGPWNNIYRIFQLSSINRVQYVRNATSLGSSPSLSSGDSRAVVGPFRLRRSIKSEGYCAFDEWANESTQMALDAGVPVGLYTQIAFMLPDSKALHGDLCGWTGLAHVGCGFQCKSWVSDCKSLGVIAHELGHNEGVSHSGSWWSFTDQLVEYGDPTAIMGNMWGSKEYSEGTDFHFAAPQRAYLNWIPRSQIMDVSSNQAPPIATTKREIDADETLESDVFVEQISIEKKGKIEVNLNDKEVKNGLFLGENKEDEDEFLPEITEIDQEEEFSSLKRNGPEEGAAMPEFPARNRYGIIYNETHYRLTSPPAPEGQNVSRSRIFHRDGSYFLPSTARIYQLTPHHVDTVANQGDPSSTRYKALSIFIGNGPGSIWLSYQIGKSVFAKAALVHYMSSPYVSQSFLIQTIVPFHDPTRNVTLLKETTVFTYPGDLFAVRVLRSSDSVMDLQVTWRCERRIPLIDLPRQTLRFAELLPGSNDTDTVHLSIVSTSQRTSFALDVANMDSDLCRPIQVDFAYQNPKEVNITCVQPHLTISPGESCRLNCELSFLSGMPSDPINITTIYRDENTKEIISYRKTLIKLLPGSCQKGLSSITRLENPRAYAIGSEPATVYLDLKNMDSSNCPSRVPALQVQVGTGWKFEFETPIPSISPGTTTTVGIRFSKTNADNNSTWAVITPLKSSDSDSGEDFDEFESDYLSKQVLIKWVPPCVQTDPLFEMNDFGVSFYVRSAAGAPARVTNLDSEACAKLDIFLDLIPDPTGVIQSAFYPNKITLAPGEYYNFPLAVMNPDFGPNSGGSFVSTTEIDFSYARSGSRLNDFVSERRDVVENTSKREALEDGGRRAEMAKVTLEQYSWTVDVPCTDRVPSMLIACPMLNAITKPSGVFPMSCQVGYRNNDPHTCKQTNFNLTVYAVPINETEVPENTWDIHDTFVKAQIVTYSTPLELIPGQTIFFEAIVTFNFTGTYSNLVNFTNGTDKAIIRMVSEMTDMKYASSNETSDFRHNAIYVTDVTFGLCKQIQSLVVNLSSTTGPYTWMLRSDLEQNVTNNSPEGFLPESPILEEPEFPVPEEEDVEDEDFLIPIVETPFGVARSVNWTISNDSPGYCKRTAFTPVLHEDTKKVFEKFRIEYSFNSRSIEPQKSENLTLQFKIPVDAILPPESDGFINVTFAVRWPFNESLTLLSNWTTLFIKATGECLIRRSSLSYYPVLINASSPEYVNTSPYSLIYRAPTFHQAKPIQFWTVLNLTNFDSYPCDSEYWNVTNSFWFSLRRSWGSSQQPFEVYLYPLDDDGTFANETQFYTVLPQTTRLFNVTVIASPMMEPGTYSIDLFANTRVAEHRSSFSIQFRILSQPPLAAWDLNAFELRNSLGIAFGHDIVWRACENAGDCVCPCKYEIFLNGEKVATTTNEETRYYGHRYSMSHAGVRATVSIVVVDSMGRRSDPFACGSSISYVPSDSNYAHLFIFLMLVAIVSFPTFALILEWLRIKDLLPLGNLVFDDEEADVVID